MNGLIFALCGLALTALALGMHRHYNRAFRKHPSRKTERGLRFAGWTFLVLSLAAAVLQWDKGVALVSWTASLALHGFVLALLFAYRPRWTAAWLAVCVLAAALAAAF